MVVVADVARVGGELVNLEEKRMHAQAGGQQ